ncbi:MAG: hypothetical protein HZB55_07715 [Deltaproteobacteria bacterium]|nr:hypothetical protein [Deltaproteobacteria bacterium]
MSRTSRAGGPVPGFQPGLVAVGFIGLLDWWTGIGVNPEIFYVVPVALTAWCSGRDTALALSATSAIG